MFNFKVGGDNSPEGTYVYSDGKYYQYVFSEKGKIRSRRSFQEVDEVLYCILEDVIFNKALEYATKNREPGKDFRRVLFYKELEIWSKCGNIYYEKKKEDIEKTLKENPFKD